MNHFNAIYFQIKCNRRVLKWQYLKISILMEFKNLFKNMRTIIWVFYFMNLFYSSVIEGVHIYITNLYRCNYLLFKREIFLCVSLIIWPKAEHVCLHIHMVWSFLCCVKQIAEGLALCLLPAQNRNKSNFTPFVLFFRYISPLFHMLLACRLILIYMQIVVIQDLSRFYIHRIFFLSSISLN